MRKIASVEPELITGADMYLFLEKDMRGGVCYIFKRNSKVNNNDLKSYDPKQESKHIMHLDTNNLSGHAISKFLPTSGFKGIDPKEFDSNKYSSNSSKGCISKVDLEYPKELLELNNDYSLAPDKIKIKREIMSNYKNNAGFYNIPIGTVKTLLPRFFW